MELGGRDRLPSCLDLADKWREQKPRRWLSFTQSPLIKNLLKSKNLIKVNKKYGLKWISIFYDLASEG